MLQVIQCQDSYDFALVFIKTRISAAVLIFNIGIFRLKPTRSTPAARATTTSILGFTMRNSRHVLVPTCNKQTSWIVGESTIIFLPVLLDSRLEDLLVLLF